MSSVTWWKEEIWRMRIWTTSKPPHCCFQAKNKQKIPHMCSLGHEYLNLINLKLNCLGAWTYYRKCWQHSTVCQDTGGTGHCIKKLAGSMFRQLADLTTKEIGLVKSWQGSCKIQWYGSITSGNTTWPQQSQGAIGKIKSTTNVSEVCCFLEMINQMKSFFPDFSCNNSAISQLLMKVSKFEWTGEIESEFWTFKNIIKGPAFVKLFGSSKKIRLYTNSTQIFGCAYVLTQEKQGLNGVEETKSYLF